MDRNRIRGRSERESAVTNMVVLVILGVVAAVILLQLYNVLGRKAGFRVDEKTAAARPEDFDTATRMLERPAEGARLPNLEALKTRDLNFNEINFLEKARETYEQVVLAFHKGELDAVKDRLSERVFGTFRKAVIDRISPRTDLVSFVDTPKADIDTVEFNDDTAQVRVRFLSELAYETPAAVEEPVPVTDGPKEDLPVVPAPRAEARPSKIHRRTAEFWTFQKGLRAQNSPWLLTKVEAAKA